MLMNNYFRAYEVTDEFIAIWDSCYYVGETTKSHEEIQRMGKPDFASNQTKVQWMAAEKYQAKSSSLHIGGITYFRTTVNI